MKIVVPFAVLGLILILFVGCPTPVSSERPTTTTTTTTTTVAPVLSLTAYYTAISDSYYGTFTSDLRVVNLGNTAISISGGTYTVYGSTGGVLNDITKTTETIVFGVPIAPGGEYTFTVAGYSAGYVPYSFGLSLQYGDSAGHTRSQSFTGDFVVATEIGIYD